MAPDPPISYPAFLAAVLDPPLRIGVTPIDRIAIRQAACRYVPDDAGDRAFEGEMLAILGRRRFVAWLWAIRGDRRIEWVVDWTAGD